VGVLSMNRFHVERLSGPLALSSPTTRTCVQKRRGEKTGAKISRPAGGRVHARPLRFYFDFLAAGTDDLNRGLRRFAYHPCQPSTRGTWSLTKAISSMARRW
jgi:hypothetical protein